MLFNALSRYRYQTTPEYSESGQAALFATILIPVVLLAGLFVFNTGQLTATKLKTQNAADAAAFSAMQMEARELNFISYTNRAMVANQVAIGQVISLVSWAHYIKNFGVNVERITRFANLIPGVGQIISQIGQAIKNITTTLDQSIDTASTVILPVLDATDAALSGAQEAYHMANGLLDPGGGNLNPGGAMTAVAEQVVQINDPNASLNAIVLATNLGQYFRNRGDLIKRWGGDKKKAQGRMAYMVNASRDGFTEARNDLPVILSPVPVRSGDLYFFGWEFRRAGGSEIALGEGGKYIWSSMDTLSLHTWTRGLFGRKKWAEIPLGLGASQTGGGDNYSYPRDYSENQAQAQERYPPQDRLVRLPAYQNSWQANPGASRQAANEYPDEQDSVGTKAKVTGGDANRFSAGGITRYWDIDRKSSTLNKANGDPADIMPYYIAVVEHNRQSVRDSVTALGISHPSTRVEMNLLLAQSAQDNQVRAIAKAQAYFRRPASMWHRADGNYERGNFFSPFWEARLMDLTTTDRAMYFSLLGLQ
ncbi:MAG: pilus assembly protein TadG-related protein [Acidithiobacillus sp.]